MRPLCFSSSQSKSFHFSTVCALAKKSVCGTELGLEMHIWDTHWHVTLTLIGNMMNINEPAACYTYKQETSYRKVNTTQTQPYNSRRSLQMHQRSRHIYQLELRIAAHCSFPEESNGLTIVRCRRSTFVKLCVRKRGKEHEHSISRNQKIPVFSIWPSHP